MTPPTQALVARVRDAMQMWSLTSDEESDMLEVLALVEAREGDAARYRFLRDNPYQLRAIDGSATWYDKAPDYFDEHVDRAIESYAARGGSDVR